jgi:hypothetical protein
MQSSEHAPKTYASTRGDIIELESRIFGQKGQLITVFEQRAKFSNLV